LRALLTLLPRLAAQLRVIMQQAGCCDFIDMTAEALRALTTTEEARGPLALEQRLEHLLVDEFQDTSIQQYRLLEAATEAWTEGDGHSLFLVGDPMQSIYRFRQADVGLFLHVQQAGLGAMRPKTLTLKANYRSKPEVLDWINQTFATIMPKQADLNRSAIPYTPAIAPENHANQTPGTVECHALNEASLLAETVCALVQTHKAQYPEHSIGLLGATRQHVMPIMQALNKAGIPYHAKEMLSLHDNISVRDVHCLTHLCCTPDDRIHQLGLLRTPWVGLSLHDIECIQQAEKTTTILDFLAQDNLPSTLSSEGSATLKAIAPVLAYFMTQRGGQPLSTWVRTFCTALGGVPQEDMEPVTAYVELLEHYDGPSFDLKVFDAQLKTRYYSQTPTCESTIHVMTMHQSKGLAFDCVILPALEKTGRSDTTPLMQCATMLTQTGQHVVLSPMPAPGMPANQTQQFLTQRNRAHSQHEKKRLLYVAATRARHALHLLATPPSAKDKAPSQGSLLHHLWPAIHNEMANPDAQASEASTNPPSQTPEVRESEKAEVLHHVAMQRTLRPITMPSPLPYRQHQIQANTQPKSPQQYAGDLMHAMMQHAADPNRLLDLTNDAAALRYASRYMRRMPVATEMQQTVVTACLKMRAQILANPRATWLLSPHPQAASEYVMERLVDGQRCTQIIDRCFWDEQSESFWIVDYKTHALQAGESIDTFAKRLRTQHQATMEAYVDTFAIRHPNKPIQWGLYALQANLWITKNAHA
jgi:ATP-dependent helicase/nuclease subunit A